MRYTVSRIFGQENIQVHFSYKENSLKVKLKSAKRSRLQIYQIYALLKHFT